jgi:FkbM family methyltransferase
MKKIIRKLLPKQQYENLAQIKNKILLNLMRKELQLLSCDLIEFIYANPELEQRFLINSIDNLENISSQIVQELVEKLLTEPRPISDELLLLIKSKTNITKKMDYEKHDIFLTIDSDVEYNIRTNSCKKEPETIEWIETFFKDGDVLFDIGANVGAYSLVTVKYWQNKVTTYAFEPSFLNFKQLCQNLVINNCQKSIIPLQIALSDRVSIETLNYQNLKVGGALHALGEAVDSQGDTFEPVFQQPVLSYSIDNAIAQLSLPIPNHLKIDVDGIEFLILVGAEQTLKNAKVKSILIEIEKDSENSQKILDLLERHGFKIHSQHRYVYGGSTGKYANIYNYIFQRL